MGLHRPGAREAGINAAAKPSYISHVPVVQRCRSSSVPMREQELACYPPRYAKLLLRTRPNVAYAVDRLATRASKHIHLMLGEETGVSHARSLKQKMVTLSSTEAEVYAAIECAKRRYILSRCCEIGDAY